MARPAAAPVPWRSPILHVVLASTLTGVLGITLVSPALPAVRTALSISDAAASLLVTAYTLPGIALSPAVGFLADRFGRRRVLVPALLLYALAGASVALTRDLGTILGLRAVQGVGASGLLSVAVTLVGDAFEGPERVVVLGVNSAVLSVGAAVSPLLGGALASVGWNAPFVCYLVGVPVAAFAHRRLAEPTGDRTVRGWSYLRGVASAIPTRTAVGLYGTITLAYILVFGGLLTAVPFLLNRRYGLDPPVIGLTIAGAALVSAVVAARVGWFAGRFSERRLVALAFACYAVGLSVVGLAGSPPVVAAGVLAVGAGQGVALPSFDAAVSRLAPPQYRAGALSFRTSMIWLGTTVGPVAFTALGGPGGYTLPLLAGGVVGGLVALVLALARE